MKKSRKIYIYIVGGILLIAIIIYAYISNYERYKAAQIAYENGNIIKAIDIYNTITVPSYKKDFGEKLKLIYQIINNYDKFNKDFNDEQSPWMQYRMLEYLFDGYKIIHNAKELDIDSENEVINYKPLYLELFNSYYDLSENEVIKLVLDNKYNPAFSLCEEKKKENIENPKINEANNSLFDEYIKENYTSLTAKDVQYDMTNNVGKYFILEGVAEASDYYNYGYDSKIESSYFCLVVTPTGEKYSSRWYIYCYRDSFNEVLEKAKNGSIKVQMVCYIDKNRYKSGQGNMATLDYIVY